MRRERAPGKGKREGEGGGSGWDLGAWSQVAGTAWVGYTTVTWGWMVGGRDMGGGRRGRKEEEEDRGTLWESGDNFEQTFSQFC